MTSEVDEKTREARLRRKARSQGLVLTKTRIAHYIDGPYFISDPNTIICSRRSAGWTSMRWRTGWPRQTVWTATRLLAHGVAPWKPATPARGPGTSATGTLSKTGCGARKPSLRGVAFVAVDVEDHLDLPAAVAAMDADQFCGPPRGDAGFGGTAAGPVVPPRTRIRPLSMSRSGWAPHLLGMAALHLINRSARSTQPRLAAVSG